MHSLIIISEPTHSYTASKQWYSQHTPFISIIIWKEDASSVANYGNLLYCWKEPQQAN